MMCAHSPGDEWKAAGSDDEEFTEADLLAMSEACAAAEAKEPSSGRPKIGSSAGKFGGTQEHCCDTALHRRQR